MKIVNSVSGGKSSAYIADNYPADYDVFALVCIDDPKCAPKDPGIIKYVNDKIEKFIPEFGEFIATAEDDQTLYAMRDLEQIIGREITWVRGASFDTILNGRQTRLPSWARRYCTDAMKLLPTFLWWFNTIGEPCRMRIGFRVDEFERMLRFFNNGNKTHYSIPVSCSTQGNKLQRHENFHWRFCDMPLIRDGIDHSDVREYWKNKYTTHTLFQERRQIVFPEISNCVDCFHKRKETLMYEALINLPKMQWGGGKELLGKGTWLDTKETYFSIIDEALALTSADKQQLIRRIGKIDGNTCDTGGCTD